MHQSFHLIEKESLPSPAPFDFGLSVCVALEYPFAVRTVRAVLWMDLDVLYVVVQCLYGRPALPVTSKCPELLLTSTETNQ